MYTQEDAELSYRIRTVKPLLPVKPPGTPDNGLNEPIPVLSDTST